MSETFDFLDDLLNEDRAKRHIEQNTDQWDQMRIGRFTSSEMWKLITQPRSKEDKESGKLSQTALDYIAVKVAERLSGRKKESSYAYPLVYGKETEPEAIEYFCEQTGHTHEKIGFVSFGDYAGGSPDGVIDGSAILEVKCPWAIETQITYLMLTDQWDLKRHFKEYYYQVQSNLLFTGAELAYFVTYDPRYDNPKFRMTVMEVKPVEEDRELICNCIAKGTEELLKLIVMLS